MGEAIEDAAVLGARIEDQGHARAATTSAGPHDELGADGLGAPAHAGHAHAAAALAARLRTRQAAAVVGDGEREAAGGRSGQGQGHVRRARVFGRIVQRLLPDQLDRARHGGRQSQGRQRRREVDGERRGVVGEQGVRALAEALRRGLEAARGLAQGPDDVTERTAQIAGGLGDPLGEDAPRGLVDAVGGHAGQHADRAQARAHLVVQIHGDAQALPLEPQLVGQAQAVRHHERREDEERAGQPHRRAPVPRLAHAERQRRGRAPVLAVEAGLDVHDVPAGAHVDEAELRRLECPRPGRVVQAHAVAQELRIAEGQAGEAQLERVVAGLEVDGLARRHAAPLGAHLDQLDPRRPGRPRARRSRHEDHPARRGHPQAAVVALDDVDLAIGAPDAADGGRVHVYLGNAWIPQAWKLIGQGSLGANEDGDRFGAALAIAQLDTDYFRELLVGAPGEKPSGSVRLGYIFVFKGGSTTLSAWKGLGHGALLAKQSGDDLGNSIAVGDFDREDGNDVIGGASRHGDGAGAAIHFDFQDGDSNAFYADQVLSQELKASYVD